MKPFFASLIFLVELWLLASSSALADMALYRLNANGDLEVESHGFRFGDQRGTLRIETVEKPFYYGRPNNAEAGLLLTPELGLAIVNRSDLPPAPTVIGLPAAASDEELKTWWERPALLFLYHNGQAQFFQLTLRHDGTFTAVRLAPPEQTITGCWRPNGARKGVYDVLLNKPRTACERFDSEKTPFAPYYARVMLAEGKRHFVLDYSDGSGFGLGVLAQSIPSLVYPHQFKGITIDEPKGQAASLFSRPIIFDLVMTPERLAIQTPLQCQRTASGSFKCRLLPRHETYQVYPNRFCTQNQMKKTPGIVCVVHSASQRRFNLLPTPRQSAFLGSVSSGESLIMGGRSTIATLPDTGPITAATP